MQRKELCPGDIMCQFYSNNSLTSFLTGRIIAFGQLVTGNHHCNIVHAGIMFDSIYSIEALNKGIRARDLRIQNVNERYLVFRPVNKNLAQGAADCANMMVKIHFAQRGPHAKNGPMPYDAKGAVKSIFGTGNGPMGPAAMDSLLDKILAAQEHPFFCSQFVVFVYQFVAEQSGLRAASLFNLADPKVPPARLASYMDTSPNFQFVGELAPGVR